MPLPPLPTPFPPGWWIVRWVAGIRRHNEAERTSSRLVLIIAPIRNHLTGTTSSAQLWRNDAVDLQRQQIFEVPLMYLAAASVGTIGVGDRLIEATHHPQTQISQHGVNILEVSVDVPVEQKYVHIDERDPVNNQLMISAQAHKFGPHFWGTQPDFHNLRNTSCLVVHDSVGRRLLIPVFELIRFYWGTSSSNFLQRLIDSPKALLLEPKSLTAFVDPAYTGCDDQGVFSCALRPGLATGDAYALSRLWLDPLARRSITNMLVGFLLNQPGGCALATQTGFPFAGQTLLPVEGVSTGHTDDAPTLLVYRIRSCTHPLPVAAMRSILPHLQSRTPVPSDKGLGPDAPQPVARFKRRGGAHPTVTSWRPPRRMRAVMYQGESLASLFPDIAAKPMIKSTGVPGGQVVSPPVVDGLVLPGGYGEGVRGGDGRPVETEPGGKADEPTGGPPPPPDATPPQVSAAPAHLITLDAAAAHLSTLGYTVSPCAQTDPEGGWFAFDPSPTVQMSERWDHIYDADLKTWRSRRGKILEVGKLYQDSQRINLEVNYGYVIDLEMEGSAFVYFEHIKKIALQEDVLQEVIRICLDCRGVWRTAKYSLIKDKKSRIYCSNLVLPEIKVQITPHWWSSNAERLAQHVKTLHESTWKGLGGPPVQPE